MVVQTSTSTEHASDPEPKIRGFVLYRSDRTDVAAGGTAVYVRRTLPHYPNALPALQNLEATAMTIETANGPLTLISCYYKPQDLLRENDITNLTWGSRETNRNCRILFDLADATDFLIEAPPEPTPKNVPFQTRLHVVNALNSDHLSVLMHIGDEANARAQKHKFTSQIGRSWWKFWKPISDRFLGLNRSKTSKTQSELWRKKIKIAMTNSILTRVEPRQQETLPQWIVDLIQATGATVDTSEANRLDNDVKYALIDHRNDKL
jgi:hypothetical protein